MSGDGSEQPKRPVPETQDDVLELDLPVDDLEEIGEKLGESGVVSEIINMGNGTEYTPYLPVAPELVGNASEWIKDRGQDGGLIDNLYGTVAGTRIANRQDEYYMKMSREPVSQLYPPGQHNNMDGSSYDVDDSGRMRSFTHREVDIKGEKRALTYSDLQYDDNGNLTHVRSPWGYTLTREGEVDEKGFGTWRCERDGQPAVYAGAGTSRFEANIAVDHNGFHNLIGSGKYEGYMYSRAGNGSLVTSRPVLEGGEIAGTTTEITNPDQSRMTRVSSFDEDGVLVADGNIKRKKVDRPGEQEPVGDILERAKEQFKELEDPIGDIADAIKKFQAIDRFDVTRGRNGNYCVDIRLDGPKTIESDLTRIIDKYRSVDTRLDQDLSFTFRPTENGFQLSNMNGFGGTVEKARGLIGRGRQRSVEMHSMSIGKNRDGTGYLRQTSGTDVLWFHVSRGATLNASDFRTGSQMNNFLRDPKAVDGLSGAMRVFQNADDIQRISMRRQSPEEFSLSVVSDKPRTIPLEDVQVGPLNVDSIELAENLTFSVREGEDGPDSDSRPDSVEVNPEGVTINIGSARLKPDRIVLRKDENGEAVLEMDIETARLKDKAVLNITTRDLETLDSASVKMNVPVVKLFVDELRRRTGGS